MSASARRDGRSPRVPASEADGATGEAPARAPSLRERTRAQLSDLGLHPSRDLGQNFLVDERFLEVVVDAAQLSRTDVVLEVGGGLGVLSRRLAAEVAHLHVVEVDRLLASALEGALSHSDNTSLHLADAVRLDFAALSPRPDKLVANLPYGIAATVLLKALEELPDAGLFVAMVQREVAERLAAPPGSRTYGATSVLAQLCGEVRVHRRVPRSAFVPAPNVDSAVVVVRRRSRPPASAVRILIRAAFAHRRKTLAGSLALDGGFGPQVRERTREALISLGHPADARAERLAPPDFVALAAELEDGSRAADERDKDAARSTACGGHASR